MTDPEMNNDIIKPTDDFKTNDEFIKEEDIKINRKKIQAVLRLVKNLQSITGSKNWILKNHHLTIIILQFLQWY